MSVQIASPDNLRLAEVSANRKALRVEINAAADCLSWVSLTGATGQLTGVTAGATLFALRYAGGGTSRLLVRRLQVLWYTFAFSAAARIDLALQLARGWTVGDSGGVVITGARHRYAHALPNVDARIAAAAALTVGTRTLDGAIGMCGYLSAANGNGIPLTSLLSHDAGDHPMVLQQNEGLVVTMPAVPAAAAITCGYVQAECTEVSEWP